VRRIGLRQRERLSDSTGQRRLICKSAHAEQSREEEAQREPERVERVEEALERWRRGADATLCVDVGHVRVELAGRLKGKSRVPASDTGDEAVSAVKWGSERGDDEEWRAPPDQQSPPLLLQISPRSHTRSDWTHWSSSEPTSSNYARTLRTPASLVERSQRQQGSRRECTRDLRRERTHSACTWRPAQSRLPLALTPPRTTCRSSRARCTRPLV